MSTIRIPKPLIESIKNSNCVPWCGAGISIPSKLPSWSSLVRLMLNLCIDIGLGTSEEAELNALWNGGLYEEITDYCRDFLGEGQYRDFLLKVFKANGHLPTQIHERIEALPSFGVFTTNYDRLLEQAMAKRTGELPEVYTSRDTETLWRCYAENQRFFLKVHGDILRPDTVILSSRDYTRHVFGNLPFMQFLQRVMLSNSVLFLGTSLTDPYIMRILEETTYLTGGVGVQHYALLPDTGTIRSKLLRDRYNIIVIPFSLQTFGTHQAAYEIFFDEIYSSI